MQRQTFVGLFAILLLAAFAGFATPQANQTQKKSASGSAVKVDGEWAGTTSQSKEITLKIENGRVLYLKLGYQIPGGRCFPIRDAAGNTTFLTTLDNTFDVSWTIPEKAPRVVNQRIALERTQTSGGANAAPLYILTGALGPGGTFSGTIQFTAVQDISEAYPNPPCQTKARATWKATRKS